MTSWMAEATVCEGWLKVPGSSLVFCQCYSDHSRRLLRAYRLEKFPVYAGSASKARCLYCGRSECYSMG
jgi:hypothetical protein